MISWKAIAAAAIVVVVICIIAYVRVENRHGRIRLILNGHGKCNESTLMNGKFLREHHYEHGKLYPVLLGWGTLVPPGSAPAPSGKGYVWMCRYHAAQWLGEDPVTGEKWAGGAPVEAEPAP